jgi:hypothetical protein
MAPKPKKKKKISTQIKLQIPGGKSESRTSGWSCAGSAWTQYHGVLQSVQ